MGSREKNFRPPGVRPPPPLLREPCIITSRQGHTFNSGRNASLQCEKMGSMITYGPLRVLSWYSQKLS